MKTLFKVDKVNEVCQNRCVMSCLPTPTGKSVTVFNLKLTYIAKISYISKILKISSCVNRVVSASV